MILVDNVGGYCKVILSVDSNALVSHIAAAGSYSAMLVKTRWMKVLRNTSLARRLNTSYHTEILNISRELSIIWIWWEGKNKVPRCLVIFARIVKCLFLICEHEFVKVRLSLIFFNDLYKDFFWVVRSLQQVYLLFVVL